MKNSTIKSVKSIFKELVRWFWVRNVFGIFIFILSLGVFFFINIEKTDNYAKFFIKSELSYIQSIKDTGTKENWLYNNIQDSMLKQNVLIGINNKIIQNESIVSIMVLIVFTIIIVSLLSILLYNLGKTKRLRVFNEIDPKIEEPYRTVILNEDKNNLRYNIIGGFCTFLCFLVFVILISILLNIYFQTINFHSKNFNEFILFLSKGIIFTTVISIFFRALLKFTQTMFDLAYQCSIRGEKILLLYPKLKSEQVVLDDILLVYNELNTGKK